VELTGLVADWSYREAAAVVRVASILASEKDAKGYRRGPGRRRFETQLRQDGLPPDRVDEVLLYIDDAFGPDLDAILDDLKARQI
jgi:hypothetical protein